MKRRNQRGLTLVELIVAFTIMLILTSMAVPLARAKVRATRERDLRFALDDIRRAIDKYKDYADAGQFGPIKQGTNGFPESLDQLVEGVKLAKSANGEKVRFLRRLPVDPFTGKREWGMRSDQDDTDSQSWGGQNVFDIYSKTMEKAPDGTCYCTW